MSEGHDYSDPGNGGSCMAYLCSHSRPFNFKREGPAGPVYCSVISCNHASTHGTCTATHQDISIMRGEGRIFSAVCSLHGLCLEFSVNSSVYGL